MLRDPLRDERYGTREAIELLDFPAHESETSAFEACCETPASLLRGPGLSMAATKGGPAPPGAGGVAARWAQGCVENEKGLRRV